MIIIPAIDIRNGKCVMLTRGRIDEEKVYSTDPVFIAKLWSMKGAKRLHIIDLDGAFYGSVKSWDIISSIRENVNCEIEFGGGVRKEETVSELIKIGIDKIIISTMFIYDPQKTRELMEKYPQRIIISLDVTNEMVTIAGWREKTILTVYESLEKVKEYGGDEVIVTDTARDGTLSGPDFDLFKKIIEKSKGLKVILSGGIGDIEHVKKINTLNPYGLILGKALYEDKINLEEAIKIASI